ncbi:MAG: pantoate--beta-alanine ligase [Schleiferiaceae bacterium]|nr:pantoate--beta-alanine ligase [Schleiferiaceae bacterium]
MRISRLSSQSDWFRFRESHASTAKIGFVPTMGALHAGHLSLVQKALSECDLVVASIFVNPTQFSDPADFEAYPLDIENDLAALESVGCQAAFCPSVEEIYPEGFKLKQLDLGGLDLVLEGGLRPGHFQGVATVVHRLFDLLQVDRAYFGLKDFQQVKVIEKLAHGRGGNLEIIPCPIVREASGLAMSSRNRRLNPEQTAAASAIFAALSFAEEELQLFPVPPRALKLEMRKMIQASGLLQVESIDFALAESLTPITDGEALLDRYPEGVQAFISAYAGEVRLIDTHRIVPHGYAASLG